MLKLYPPKLTNGYRRDEISYPHSNLFINAFRLHLFYIQSSVFKFGP